MITEVTTRQADQIPPVLIAEMEEAITHYPVSKRSASLPLLHLWQNHFGFIDDSGVDWIATKLELNSINILELVTFYPWFRQHAPGKTVIRVCRTLACALAGSHDLHAALCQAANIDHEDALHHHGGALPTSPDGKFSIEFVECLASCGTAPVLLVNDDLHENVSPDKASDVLKEYSSIENRKS